MNTTAHEHSRVLVIDDDPAMRRVTARYFERVGFSVSLAATGEEAELVSSTCQPDVVVCDWHLGSDDGVEVVRALQRKHDCYAILVTSDSLAALRQAAAGLRVADFFRKPLSLEALAEAVVELLDGVA